MTDFDSLAADWNRLGQTYETSIFAPDGSIGIQVLSFRSELLLGPTGLEAYGMNPYEFLAELAVDLGLELHAGNIYASNVDSVVGYTLRDLMAEAIVGPDKWAASESWRRAVESWRGPGGGRRYLGDIDPWLLLGYEDLRLIGLTSALVREGDADRPITVEQALLRRVMFEPSIPTENSPPSGQALAEIVRSAAAGGGGVATGLLLGGATPLGVVLAGASIVFFKVCIGVGDGLAARSQNAILEFGKKPPLAKPKSKQGKKKGTRKKKAKRKSR